MSAFFITGTDTEIGKTVVTASLLAAASSRGIACAGLKPIASGCEVTADGLRNEDALAIMEQASVMLPYETVNHYSFVPAIAPHIAAAKAGESIDIKPIKGALADATRKAELVLVEGVGGWKVPLSGSMDVAQLAVELNLPVILVVGMRLGCINHALLTAESVKASGLKLQGWVANQVDPEMSSLEENLATLKLKIGSPLLGFIPYNEKPDPHQLQHCFDRLPF